MAFQKTITLQNNFGENSILSDCYCKVTRVVGNKEQVYATLEIQNKDRNKVYESKSYGFEPSVADNSKNFIAQSYDYIKSLPEYAGAVDC